VLPVERLVFEFGLENRAAADRLDSAALDEHAGDDAVNLCVCVGNLLAVRCALKAAAKLDKVVAGLGRQVVEELKNDFLGDSLARDVHVDELASCGSVKGIDLTLVGLLRVVVQALVDLARVVVQCPGLEFALSPNIVTIVQHDQALVSRVIVEHAL